MIYVFISIFVLCNAKSVVNLGLSNSAGTISTSTSNDKGERTIFSFRYYFEESRKCPLLFLLVTARNEVGARLCFYTCLWCCSPGGWYPCMHCRWYHQHALQQVLEGVVSRHALQVSRPTPRGKAEGSGLGGLQAHTQGVSRSTPRRGVYPNMHWGRPPPNGYCCGQYASYWNAFLFHEIRQIISWVIMSITLRWQLMRTRSSWGKAMNTTHE